MAKRSRNNRPPRDTFAQSLRNRVRVVVWPRPWVSPKYTLNPVRQVLDDRRTWHPERWGRPVLATHRAATRVVVAPKPGPLLTSRLAFAEPRKVLVCHRRKTRREVLLAHGQGGGGKRSPKRKPTSEITC